MKKVEGPWNISKGWLKWFLFKSKTIKNTYEVIVACFFTAHFSAIKVVPALWRFLMDFYEILTLLLILPQKFTVQKLASTTVQFLRLKK